VKSNGARSMTAFMDVLAGLSVAAQLHSAPLNPSPAAFATQSMMLAKEEVRSGMYKEYTVDVPEQSNTLDDVRKGYKTAAETDEGKTKVRLIFPSPPPLATLLARATCLTPSCFCAVLGHLCGARRGIVHHPHGAILLVCRGGGRLKKSQIACEELF
jgi:hypothetical protein